MNQPKRYCEVAPKECSCKTGHCVDNGKTPSKKKKKGSK